MGIGFSELIVIALVLIIFIRPDDLPAFFRKLGKLYAELKKAYDELTEVKDAFIKEVESAAAPPETKQADGEGSSAKKPAPEAEPEPSGKAGIADAPRPTQKD